MPFNVNLADNEDPLIHANTRRAPGRRSKSSREFVQGLTVGCIFVAFVLATYWLASEMVARHPELQSLLPF